MSYPTCGHGIALNDAGHLPPVRCPLLIEVDGQLIQAYRTSFVEQRDRQMEYRLENGQIIIGRYRWTYP